VIRQEFSDTGILVLSAHVDAEHAMELLASGHGIGCLLKSKVSHLADLIDTLQHQCRHRVGAVGGDWVTSLSAVSPMNAETLQRVTCLGDASAGSSMTVRCGLPTAELNASACSCATVASWDFHA
jgi:hypothetical protein